MNLIDMVRLIKHYTCHVMFLPQWGPMKVIIYVNVWVHNSLRELEKTAHSFRLSVGHRPRYKLTPEK